MRAAGMLKAFLALLVLAVVAVAGAGAWLWQDYRTFVDAPLGVPEQGVHYTVERGVSLRRVAADLKALGILAKPLYLRLLGRERGDANAIKAGEYALTEGMTPTVLLDLLVSGKVVEYSVTLVEGLTFTQFMESIRQHPVIKQTLPAEASSAEVMAAVGSPGEHPEGRFFPDTYLFPKGTTDVRILRWAHERMAGILAQEWESRSEGLPLETPYEALTLASIIEKETGKAEERAQIAGVFVRRLQKGMLLQTDPTVIYGMGDRFDGNIRRSDLKRDTPYNTYTRAGLTPTPICMPGRDAIHAALHPADGKALYFVAKGDGGHQFSATLAEHNRAVRRYQLKKKDQ